jgi:hypothetical protein
VEVIFVEESSGEEVAKMEMIAAGGFLVGFGFDGIPDFGGGAAFELP